MAIVQPAIPPPQLHLPHSPHTVSVSIINTTAHLSQIPSCLFLRPAYQGHKLMDIANFAFLIEHNGQKILFDLGVRKDWEANSPPSLVDPMKLGGWKVEVEKSVSEILQDNGISLDSIDAVIWRYVFRRTCQACCADKVASHHHVAHTGDPSRFPSKTSLVVGPGFKRLFTPSYHDEETSPPLKNACAGRAVREISFRRGFKLGRFPALDYFGDGSFYLLASPGHEFGHMCGLARTTSSFAMRPQHMADRDTFIFMGGDIAHHGGEFRPSVYRPLPSLLPDFPLFVPCSTSQVRPPCPGELLATIHCAQSATEPFYTSECAEDQDKAIESIRKMMEFDARDTIFVVLAHDATLLNVIDCYPATANDWYAKEWAKKSRWLFLNDFEEDVGEYLRTKQDREYDREYEPDRKSP